MGVALGIWQAARTIERVLAESDEEVDR